MSNETALRHSPATIKRMITVSAFMALWFGLLFGAGGRLDWTRAWIYAGLSLLGLAVNSAAVLWKNPGLIAERWKRRKDTKHFDKVFAVLYLPTAIALPVVAGLDAARYGWSPLPWWTVWPGVLLLVLSIPPIAWAMATNPHLETTVRIQHDRGHKVITTGPYAIVRHPMYVGAILGLVGAPLVLGSAWAFVPAGLTVLTFLCRTALEDRTLRRELPGYEDYAQRTRYRLAPGVW